MTGDLALSVIVPTLNEAAVIRAQLERLAPLRAQGAELIVVDGGSDDATADIATAAGARVLTAPAGRARQMNLGAASASGSLLWFLHADSAPTTAALEAIPRLVSDPQLVWGRFDVRLDAPGLAYRVIGYMINLRSASTGIATGDQGIYVRRAVFERLGGYVVQPLMEDIELCRRLRHEAAPTNSDAILRTSARRWQRHGLVRTVLHMWLLRVGYFIGVPAERLARSYPPCSTSADC